MLSRACVQQMVAVICWDLRERRCRIDHTGAILSPRNVYCVHMCTALNLAITERTGDRGVQGAGKQGIRCGCWGPLGFLRMVVPAGAASRVSLQKGVISRGGIESQAPRWRWGAITRETCSFWGSVPPSQAGRHQRDRNQMLRCPSR